jgi:putative ABC transport system substrate-binding protein
MRRREFIAFAGGATAWPIAGRGQQRTTPVVAFVNVGSADNFRLTSLRKGLSEMGYVEGRNVAIEFRGVEQYDQLPGLIADLVRRQVAVIVTVGNVATSIAKRATTTIPIVFNTGDDPIAVGLVSSLNQPGGNVTGTTTFVGALQTKRLGLLHEAVPAATAIAMLVNPTNANSEANINEVQAAARKIGVEIFVGRASTEAELEPTLQNLIEKRVSAVLINTDTIFTNAHDKLATLAIRYRLPAIYGNRLFAQAGGLMSYGIAGGSGENYRLIGYYVGGILRGVKPGQLPIRQPHNFQFELVINFKTAKTIGLAISESFLFRADEIIQ